MNPAGQLTIRARYHAGRLDGIESALERPPVARLFVGQAPEVVVKTVPYLYTLCAQAQQVAAQAAISAATGAPPWRPVDDGELWIEFLHENLWRLLLDWPAALAVEPARDAFAAWRAARRTDERIAATQALLAGPLHDITEICRKQLVDRDQGKDTAAARDDVAFAWPAFDPEAWLACWRAGVAVPEIARPASISAAYSRRLAETAEAAAALAAARSYPRVAAGDDACAVGQVLTARGVLTHAVRIADGKVAEYRVWAPTDAAFADAGGLTGLLTGLDCADIDAARRAADQAVLALDPCLPYDVELSHA